MRLQRLRGLQINDDFLQSRFIAGAMRIGAPVKFSPVAAKTGVPAIKSNSLVSAGLRGKAHAFGCTGATGGFFK